LPSVIVSANLSAARTPANPEVGTRNRGMIEKTRTRQKRAHELRGL
jgi:hypothetical protein